MQATQTNSEGLKREFKVVVPAAELEAKLETNLADLKDKVRINGFRPGKVPVAHLRRVYGRAVMADIVQNAVNEANQKIVEDNKLKLALEPHITFPEAKEEVEAVMNAKADLAYTVALEVLPSFQLADLSGVSLTREVTEISDAELQDGLDRMAKQNRQFSSKEDAAASGDRLTIDFAGKIDGTPFDGGTGTDVQIELGLGQFIPGFEDQLVGAKAGEQRLVKVTFPENYTAQQLAGKAAEFDVTVKKVEAPGEAKIDDDLAKAFGLEGLDALKKALRERVGRDFAAQSRRKLKKGLLDALDKVYDFELPPSLVEKEFEGIWSGMIEEMGRNQKTFADEETTEEKAREDYRRIAERRVRLGLVLAEVGERAGVKIADEEVTQAIVERARQFPGQEKVVWDYYRKNPQALAEIRAPIFEEKVVDHLLSQVKVADKKVTKEALFADEDAKDGAEAPKA
jgi:trigger factor